MNNKIIIMACSKIIHLKYDFIHYLPYSMAAVYINCHSKCNIKQACKKKNKYKKNIICQLYNVYITTGIINSV